MLSLSKYRQAFELGFESALAYRLNFTVSLISAAFPIFIQTFMWTAIYQNSQQEVVYGFTFKQMIAYTFLAGLTSRLIRTGFEHEIMLDVKNGLYSRFLVQPLGYFPYRMAAWFGQKLPGQSIILAILAVMLVGLSLFGGITLEPLRLAGYALTIVMAALLNFVIFYGVSAVAFWIVDIGFLFEGIRISAVLLSGGIFPLEVFGAQFVAVMRLLPFMYTVNFPLNVLNGRLSLAEVGQGLLLQCLWIGICLGLAELAWRAGRKRYVAVGG